MPHCYFRWFVTKGRPYIWKPCVRKESFLTLEHLEMHLPFRPLYKKCIRRGGDNIITSNLRLSVFRCVIFNWKAKQWSSCDLLMCLKVQSVHYFTTMVLLIFHKIVHLAHF